MAANLAAQPHYKAGVTALRGRTMRAGCTHGASTHCPGRRHYPPSPAGGGARLRTCAAAPQHASADPPASGVVAQLENLWANHSQLEAEDLAAQVAAIEAQSAAGGSNKVDAALNDGRFQAAALSGRLKKVTGAGAALTLGALTFGAAQPAGLELAFRPLPDGMPPVFKGQRQGVPNAYTVTSAFSVPGHDLAGVSEAVGTYVQDPENPQRLHITFTEVVISPDWGQEADSHRAMERWAALLGGANPEEAVDAASGRLTVQLAAPASAWFDYLVMLPGWQMARTSHGSIALMREVTASL